MFFNICVNSTVRLRHQGSNVSLTSLLQILVVYGDGERKTGEKASSFFRKQER